jgi:AcrR family transcriptional regulator
MDKRVLKTKKALHNAMCDLLAKKPFSKITVTDICNLANTGRVTFYIYYDNKYDLLEDCLNEIYDDAIQQFTELQKANSDHDFYTSISNMLDVVYYVLDSNLFFTSHNESSTFFMTLYYRFVMKILDVFNAEAHSYGYTINKRYDQKQLNSFLTFGVIGYVNTFGINIDREAIKDSIAHLLFDILHGNLIQAPPAASSHPYLTDISD